MIYFSQILIFSIKSIKSDSANDPIHLNSAPRCRNCSGDCASQEMGKSKTVSKLISVPDVNSFRIPDCIKVRLRPLVDESHASMTDVYELDLLLPIAFARRDDDKCIIFSGITLVLPMLE